MSPAKTSAGHPGPSPGRLVLLWGGMVVLAGAGLWFGPRAVRNTRVSAALPPPVAIQNSTLRDLLANAQSAAATGDLGAVAELGRLYHANGFLQEAAACWRLLIQEQPRE